MIDFESDYESCFDAHLRKLAMKRLINNEITIDQNVKTQVPVSGESKSYKKEAFIHQKQIDYLEVSLEAQAVHLVCINKRQSCWFTFACRNLTE